MNAPEDLNMAQSNLNDPDTNDSSDFSSQLSEMKENYERKINELHLEFSQLKDLMMAVIDKTSNDSQPSSSQGPSKQPPYSKSLYHNSNLTIRVNIDSNLFSRAYPKNTSKSHYNSRVSLYEAPTKNIIMQERLFV